MLRAVLLGLAIAVAFVGAARAGTSSHGCRFTGTAAGTAGTAPGGGTAKRTVAANESWCYRYVAADGVHDTGIVRITAPSALIVFDPDLFQTIITTARLIPHFCPQGEFVESANEARSCISLGGANANASLDGTEGASSAQNAAIRVGPGAYYFEVSAACEAGDTCQITVQGEGEGSH